MVDAKNPYPWELPPAPGDAPPMLSPVQDHQPATSQEQVERFGVQDTDRPVVDVTNVINFDPSDYDGNVSYDPYPVYSYGIQPIVRGGGRMFRPHRGGGHRVSHHGGHRPGGGSHSGHRGHHGVGEVPAFVPVGSNMLGVAIVAVAAGAGIGWKFGGGAWGALAGALYGGAAVNAVSAARGVLQGDPASDKESAVRGTFAVAGAAGATYILYKTRKTDDEET